MAFTESNWTNIGGGSSVEEWKPKKQYNTNDIVINDNKLYLCIQRNMSTESFEDDSSYWVLLSATEYNNNYGQVSKLGAKGDAFNVSVQKTTTFSFPPVEVLKYVSTGESTVTPATFDKDEAKQYTYDKDSVDFDGSMCIKTEFDINSSEPVTITDGTTTGYISESDTIDFSRWKSVDSIGIS